MHTALLLLLMPFANGQIVVLDDEVHVGALTVGMYWYGGFTEREWDAAAAVDKRGVRLAGRTDAVDANELLVRLPDDGAPVGLRYAEVTLVSGEREQFECRTFRNKPCVFDDVVPGNYTVIVKHNFWGRVTLRGVRVVAGKHLDIAVATPPYERTDIVEFAQPEVYRSYLAAHPAPFRPDLDRQPEVWSRSQQFAVWTRFGCEPEFREVDQPSPGFQPCLL